jgi:CRISPR-associated endonuclease/helicase Cas3
VVAFAIKRIREDEKNKVEENIDINVINFLSNKNNLVEAFSFSLNKGLFDDKNISEERFEEIKQFNILKKNKTTILYNIFALIISHHKLPNSIGESVESDVSASTGYFKPSVKKFFNLAQSKRRGLNFEFDTNKYNFLVDVDSKFIESFSSRLKDLSFNLIENKDLSSIDSENFLALNMFYSRISIMLADRYFSSIKDPETIYDEKQFYANSISVDDKPKHAQTVEDHLLGVAKHTHSNIRRIYNMLENKDLPAIESGRIPSTLKTSGVDKNNRFYWQDDMIIKTKRKHREGVKESGFFGNICAGTGTGKTRANAKLISALSDEIRYTLGVGLRTLTLQTNSEYLEDVGLNKKDVAMLIGSQASKKMYERNKKEKHKLGTYADNEDEIAGEFSSYLDESNFVIGDGMASMLKPKEQIMIQTPVVVCTTDHIIGVSDLTKGRHLSSSLRVMTSDLILDEIDSYSNMDLVAIGKLIYRTGMSGRKVIISSATVGSSITLPLFKAYYEGYKKYCELMDIECNIFSGWFSEYADINKILKVKDIKHFKEKNTSFLSSFIEKIDNGITRRKGELIDTNELKSEEEIYKKIFDYCHQYHNNHYTKHPEKDIQVSFGAVRFNTVKKCRNFFKYQLNFESNRVIKSLCYHSKNMPFILNIQEKELNSLLKRKNKDDIFKNKKVIDAVNMAESVGVSDIMFIISTTSIEEVGRDHDFDYGITEPTLYRSIIQFAGRIKRHRVEEVNKENFGILNRTINEVLSDGEGKVLLDKQSIINKLQKNSLKNSRKSQHPEKFWNDMNASDFNELIDLNNLKNITAKNTLCEEQDCNDLLSLYEYKNKEFFLSLSNNKKGNVYSLENYIHTSDCTLTTEHYEANKFRFSLHSMVFFQKDFNNKTTWFKYIDDKKDAQDSAVNAQSSVNYLVLEDKYNRILISEEEYESEYQSIVEDLNIEYKDYMKEYLRSISINIYDKGDLNFNIDFNMVIGGNR